VVDSSVIVKWFKEGEEHEAEALGLRDGVLDSSIEVSCSELMPLEVCRGLMKAGFPKEKTVDALESLNDMAGAGFLKFVPVSDVAKGAGEGIINLNLYVIDAITLSVSFSEQLDLVTENKHLFKEKVLKLARERDLNILRLIDLPN